MHLLRWAPQLPALPQLAFVAMLKVLKVEGPTSADAGVVSCLLFDTETDFRRLRDDFWDGMVFEDGMKRLGGIELPKREYVGSSRENGAVAAYGNLELCGRQRRDTRRK